MNVKVLKPNGTVTFFNPQNRDAIKGLFLVFNEGNDRLILIIDEAGHMFHLAPFYKIKKALGLTLAQCIGGGEYRKRELRSTHIEAAWAIIDNCSLTDRHRSISSAMLEEIAQIITNGDTWFFSS